MQQATTNGLPGKRSADYVTIVAQACATISGFAQLYKDLERSISISGIYNQRVYEGSHIKMKGYVSVQRKLLALIYTLWKKNEAFDKEYVKQASGDEEPVPSFA